MIVIDRSTRAFLPAGELGRNDDYEGKVHSELMELRVQVSMGSEASPADEQRLVAEVLAKDRKATADFVGRCSDWVYSFVRYRLTPRTEMVEDLTQETLLAAWQSLPNFRGDGNLHYAVRRAGALVRSLGATSVANSSSEASALSTPYQGG